MNKILNIFRVEWLFSLVTHDSFDKFTKLKTHEERFRLILERITGFSRDLCNLEYRIKLTEYSIKLRKDGNESFISSQYFKAVREYTESIMYAVSSSEELALAYANRSAVLFKLAKYEDSLKDIDRALNAKYPDRLKAKVHKRKELCLMQLNRPGVNSDMSPVTRLLENATNVVLPQILEPNPDIPCASDAISIKYSKKYGQHIVATRKIKPGEILVIEKPYCKRLLLTNIHTHCTYCLLPAWAMIPCDYCVIAAYCSEACKNKAWDEYHEIECPIVGLLTSLNVPDSISMCMRMAIIATKKGTKIDALKQEVMIAERNTDLCKTGYSNDGKFHSDQYCSIHRNHVNHVDKTVAEERIREAIWVAITVCILAKGTHMFGKKLMLGDTLVENPDVMFIGELMLKHMHFGAIIKLHKIEYYIPNGHKLTEIGDSLMALGSLFNHSCDNNIFKQWRSDLVAVTFAVCPIEEGEQIFNNYELEFSMMTKMERQKRFTLWHFTCECIACTENWPLIQDVPSYKKQSLTQQNKKKIDEAMLRFQTVDDITGMITHKSSQNMLKELLKLVEILYTFAKRPCRELISVNSMIAILRSFDTAVLNHKDIRLLERILRAMINYERIKRSMFVE